MQAPMVRVYCLREETRGAFVESFIAAHLWRRLTLLTSSRSSRLMMNQFWMPVMPRAMFNQRCASDIKILDIGAHALGQTIRTAWPHVCTLRPSCHRAIRGSTAHLWTAFDTPSRLCISRLRRKLQQLAVESTVDNLCNVLKHIN